MRKVNGIFLSLIICIFLSACGMSQEEYDAMLEEQEESGKTVEEVSTEIVPEENAEKETETTESNSEVVDKFEYEYDKNNNIYVVILKDKETDEFSVSAMGTYDNVALLQYDFVACVAPIAEKVNNTFFMGKIGEDTVYYYMISDGDCLVNEIPSDLEKIEENYEEKYIEMAEQLEDFYVKYGIYQPSEDLETEETLEDYTYSEPYFSYIGSGDDVIVCENTTLSYAHIAGGGNGHFAVKGHHDGSYDLLVNTTDTYDGYTLIYESEEYQFEINSKGDFSIELYSIGTTTASEFSGTGDYVSPIFIENAGIYEITANGKGHFAVKGWYGDGYDLLVNTTDEKYSGKVRFNHDGEYAFFEVTASRDWTITAVE